MDVFGDVKYVDEPGLWGYGVAQFLNERLGSNCVYFGPDPDETAHQIDEHVSISSMEKVREVYRRLVEFYCVTT